MEINTEEYLNKIRRRRDEKNLPRNERDEMLDLFLAKLNASRIADGFAKLTHARLAKMLTGIPTGQLYPLYQECDRAKSFGGLLNWKLKNPQ